LAEVVENRRHHFLMSLVYSSEIPFITYILILQGALYVAVVAEVFSQSLSGSGMA